MRINLVKLFIVILAGAAAVVGLSGCGTGKSSEGQTNAAATGADKKKMTIVTSFYPMYIAAANIVKDIPGVEVINLTKPQTGCLHDYQLTPEDVVTLEKAKVFVVNGAGMEAFLEKTVKQQPNLKIIDASKDILLLKDEKGEANPHVWVSVSDAILQVKNIAGQLAAIDAANGAKYMENADAYIKKLSALRDKMHASLTEVKRRDMITFHEAFPYFAKEFGLNIAAVVEREPGTEPSPKELGETIEKVRAAKIQALFTEPQYPAKAAETIARETGAKVFALDPIVTGEAKAGAENDYINKMEQNLITLREALQ